MFYFNYKKIIFNCKSLRQIKIKYKQYVHSNKNFLKNGRYN